MVSSGSDTELSGSWIGFSMHSRAENRGKMTSGVRDLCTGVRDALAFHQPLVIPDRTEERVDSAVLIPLVVYSAPEVLLVVRGKNLREHAGEVGFPGGKKEAGDVSLLSTALREAEEEIGLSPNSVEVLGSLSPMPVATSRYRIHPFVGWVEQPPTWVLSGEIDRLVSLPLRALLDGEIPCEKMQMTWVGVEIEAPCYVVDPKTRIYGASAFVLMELLSVVGPVLARS